MGRKWASEKATHPRGLQDWKKSSSNHKILLECQNFLILLRQSQFPRTRKAGCLNIEENKELLQQLETTAASQTPKLITLMLKKLAELIETV